MSSAVFHATRPLVGVIPAAGRATRLSPLPCSKELVPVGTHAGPAHMRGRPKVVSEYLLDQMREAGVQRAFFVLRDGKFDIPAYYGNGARLGIQLAYLMASEPWGPPFTVAQAAPFVSDATVVLGFPDLLIDPPDMFCGMLQRLESTRADMVLALLPATPGSHCDRVRRESTGRVTRVLLKEMGPPVQPGEAGCLHSVWGPRFTRFLLEETQRLGQLARSGAAGESPDWSFSSVVQSAVLAGLHVDSLMFERARFVDIGTPAGYAAAFRFPGVGSHG